MSDCWEDVTYLNGFGNEFESEAECYQGSLPRGLINPQRPEHGLYAEQLSGSAFTAPRGSNKRSWLYRTLPSVSHTPFGEVSSEQHNLRYDGSTTPNQMRWVPYTMGDDTSVDFVGGLFTLAYSDKDGSSNQSVAIHIYNASEPMVDLSMVNSDGDFLFVPQMGTLLIKTEFGRLIVEPNEIAVIQQGMAFSIDSHNNEHMRGYILEVKGNHFELPYLGPIGANGLANPRDFQTPKAWMDEPETRKREHVIIRKFKNKLFEATQTQSPFDVAAWFGNYVPYKYSLNKFVSVNSVSVDHPDPSIFTVLTCPSIGKPGTALADFVIFPPRWECATNTFRVPYYHRNCMTEFMGLIKGQYQAKSGQFAPGGGSLHQAMMPHGPDTESFVQAFEQDTSQPRKIDEETMAFMFETSLTLDLTNWAQTENVDADYYKCWQGLAPQED